MEEIRYLPKGVSPLGFSVKEVRGRDDVDWLGDVVVKLLKSFPISLLEECPLLFFEEEGEAGRWRLKKLLIGSATPERMFFLGSLGLCELSFSMLTMVRDNELSCAALSFIRLFRSATILRPALPVFPCPHLFSLPLTNTQASSPECKPTFFYFCHSFLQRIDLA